jgi:dolichyl-diphosphooligosaccharide--protein glycosyltransferase
MFMSNATQAAKIAKQIATGPDGKVRPVYVLEFITGSIVPDNNGNYYYILQVPSGTGWFTAGGGDESKKQWFIRIGNLAESKYLECVTASASCLVLDDFNLTPYALQSSLFAQLLPFKFSGYLIPSVDQQTGSVTFSMDTTGYRDGTIGSNNVAPFEGFSYPSVPLYNYTSSGPFRLAYASPSITTANPTTNPSATQCPGNPSFQCFNGIVVYQVVP